MLEEEIKTVEQERETLRIEAQRLRDELSDLKIEADITQEKLKAAEAANEKHLKRISHFSDSKELGIQSPTSEGSVTSASLLSTFTPERPKSQASIGNGSDAITPPSPPLSEQSGSKQNIDGTLTSQTHANAAQRDPHITPKPSAYATANRAIHNRERSRNGPHRPPPVFARPRTTAPRPRASAAGMEGGVPRSESLHQIRGLIGKMQKLEQRVHSARSKLPAPTNTPPRASPRGGSVAPSALSSEVPSNVTVRSSRKRASGSTNVSATPSHAPTEGSVKRLNHRQSRISVSGATSAVDNSGRPDSRVSNASHNGFVRPSSRVETYARPSSAAEAQRPRSSLAGRVTPSHGHRQSLSRREDGDGNEDSFITPTPRRMTDKVSSSAIPAPTNLARRQSNQALTNGTTPGRRKSMKQISTTALHGSTSAVPRPSVGRKSTDLGETF